MSNEDNSRDNNYDLAFGRFNPKTSLLSLAKIFSFEKNNDENDTSIKEIECRVEFVNIGEVDTFNEQFKAYVIIRSRWYETEKIVEYDAEKQWNPKLYIQNLIADKFYETVTYKLIQHENATEVIETRSCKGYYLVDLLRIIL